MTPSIASASNSFAFFFCFKQKTAYEMRISDWSSDVCSSDLLGRDVLQYIVHGAQVSLYVGFSAAFAATILGSLIGAVSGYVGGREIGRASCRARVCQYV